MNDNISEKQNQEDNDEIIGENISNEEYKKRFLKKFMLYKEGKLTIDDFEGYEVFLLSDMLKDEAYRSLNDLDDLVRERNIKASKDNNDKNNK